MYLRGFTSFKAISSRLAWQVNSQRCSWLSEVEMDEAGAGIPHAKESVLYLLLMCPIVNGHRLRHHSAQTVKGGRF